MYDKSKDNFLWLRHATEQNQHKSPQKNMNEKLKLWKVMHIIFRWHGSCFSCCELRKRIR